MINREEYRRFINPAWPMINTGTYARIESAKGNTVWRAVCVYHLPGNINGGQHVVFCDTLSDSGAWSAADGLRIAYAWDGKSDGPLYRPFEKRPPEPRAQVDLYKGQITTVWVDDPRYPSDKVVGLHSAVADTQDGNTLFHNSFVVLWQLVGNAITTPPIDPVGPPPSGDVAALRAENLALRNLVARYRQVVAGVVSELGGIE
jgi:hypothetical protein